MTILCYREAAQEISTRAHLTPRIANRCSSESATIAPFTVVLAKVNA